MVGNSWNYSDIMEISHVYQAAECIIFYSIRIYLAVYNILGHFF